MDRAGRASWKKWYLGLGLLSDLIGERNSLGGKEDQNKSLEKGKDCVASWKPQLPH